METSKDVIPIDINAQGQLVLKRAPTFQDSVARLINQIWEETPGTFENSKPEEISKEAKNRTEATAEAEDEFSIERFQQMRANLANRLLEAHKEALIALNLMNVIVSNPSINPSAASGNENELTHPPIPPETIRATYANPPRFDLKRRIRDVKLQLASKRQQLSSASQLMERRTTRVREVNRVEKAFWAKLFQLRALGWVLQSPKPPTSFRGPRPFYINYGFSHAGSKFSGAGTASVTRCEEKPGDLKIEPQLEHVVPKTVVLHLISSNDKKGVIKPDFPSNLLARFTLPVEPVAEGLALDSQVLASHRLLQNARNTLLETELFFQLTHEARALDGVSSLSSESLSILIDDSRQLLIMLVEISSQEVGNSNPPLDPNPDVDLCADLKLMMMGRLRLHHHHHLELRRRRLTRHLPTPPGQPAISSLDQLRDPSILRFGIEMARYHFFYHQLWDSALAVISQLPQAKGRVKSELIPLPGTLTAMFYSSHLLQVLVDDAYAIQFKLNSPRHLQALLPKASLQLDREIGRFSHLLSEEIKARLDLLDPSTTQALSALS
ncbi:RNA polymerase II mediator complex subunit [Massospora cicadina]|nr:RNA polymerase II mediator complex subunit [Massospora cicadina]